MSSTIELMLAALLAIGQYQAGSQDIRKISGDQLAVAHALHRSCQSLLTLPAFKGINIDNLVLVGEALLETSKKKKASQKTTADKIKSGLDIKELIGLYNDLCKKKPGKDILKKLPIAKATARYLKLSSNLPNASVLKDKLKQTHLVRDRDGRVVSHISEPRNRRVWVPISRVPKTLQDAFVAAEDKRFWQHNGVDQNGILRAFMKTFLGGGIGDGDSGDGVSGKGIQGGSSITQQLVKNRFVGSKVTLSRKIKELALAREVEKKLSKKEILEYYMNLIYFGRSSWGVELAAKSYFGKSVHKLNIAEMAFIAGLPKGPNNYEPEKHLEKALKRKNYVLGRLLANKKINQNRYNKEKARELRFSPRSSVAVQAGHFNQHIKKLLKKNILPAMKAKVGDRVEVQSTLSLPLQRSVELALQKGLTNYEISTGRRVWSGKLGNIAKQIKAYKNKGKTGKVAIQKALGSFSKPHSDIRFLKAVYLGKSTVGFTGGGKAKLNKNSRSISRKLSYGDVIYVTKAGKRLYQIRHIPKVQGAAIVMNAHSGEILAMAGSFSYSKSQYNRSMLSLRQPGSTLKPFIYYLGLQSGLQPNTLLRDSSIFFNKKRGCRSWSPKNFSGKGSSAAPMFMGLVKSKNLMTAHLFKNMSPSPEDSLDQTVNLMTSFGLYNSKENKEYCYPFILGSEETSLFRLVRAYAALANNGKFVKPRFIREVRSDKGKVYKTKLEIAPIKGLDISSIKQTRQMMQAVVRRGTAHRMKNLGRFVGGKTGTSNRSNSAWFMGISHDLVVGVFLGYDNGRKQRRRNLGGSGTGGKRAVPIAKEIFESAFAIIGGKKPINNDDHNLDSVGMYPRDGFVARIGTPGTVPMLLKRNLRDTREVVTTTDELTPEGLHDSEEDSFFEPVTRKKKKSIARRRQPKPVAKKRKPRKAKAFKPRKQKKFKDNFFEDDDFFENRAKARSRRRLKKRKKQKRRTRPNNNDNDLDDFFN